MNENQIVGSILGTAVGDALGLPYEGLSRRRAANLLGPPDRYRFCLARGMVSDDTEHTCMVAQSLDAAGGDVDAFQRSLARRLRFWLLGIPAGIGMATLRAIVRLWFGVPPSRCGVFSAGNGPAMRSAIIGAAVSDLESTIEFVRASTRLTHTDPKAEFGAIAVALAARTACEPTPVSAAGYLSQLESILGNDGDELLGLISDAVASVHRNQTTEGFADVLGLEAGVSGFVYHSVPVAIHAWLAHPKDFDAAVASVIRCGGDTDTTAAIVGGIVGASVGRAGIPTRWLDGLMEWPRTVSWMERLGTQLASCSGQESATQPVRLSGAALFVRNLLFLAIVLYHGIRRLAPPY